VYSFEGCGSILRTLRTIIDWAWRTVHVYSLSRLEPLRSLKLSSTGPVWPISAGFRPIASG